MLHVSDHFYGRLDVIPGRAYIATEFVCALFIPVLPRRSMLFFANPAVERGTSAVSIRLSLRSIFVAYARMILLFLLLVGVGGFFEMFPHIKPDQMVRFVLLMTALVPGSCLGLYILWRLSFVSSRYRQRLSDVSGLPADIVAQLRSKDRDELALDELAPRSESLEF
jgi:hypothetical protein